MRTIHSSRIWGLRCFRSRVAYASAWSSASRAGLISFRRVPLRPSAALRSRLCRLWAVTPRLTRAIGRPLQVREEATELLLHLRAEDRLPGVAAGGGGRPVFQGVGGPRPAAPAPPRG